MERIRIVYDIVIKNGRVMDPETLYDGVALEVFPGQLIRYEPAARPRFEPVSIEAWEAIYNAAIEIRGGECVPVPGDLA